ncbi:hypothetical protein NDU88_005136 [Pleurodeles waltl]|uniref:Uncharacterized protein n=1 Tax=Pleurodeles waltl TaxID=8319 RepID=A0AAV7NPE8_PLEWA|nr:hypothetical protein NDU88_005136 [Pleurodeles waltl]
MIDPKTTDHSSEVNGCSSYMMMDGESFFQEEERGVLPKDVNVNARREYGELRRTQRSHKTPEYLKDYISIPLKKNVMSCGMLLLECCVRFCGAFSDRVSYSVRLRGAVAL